MRITGVVKGTTVDAVVAANNHMLQINVLHVLADSVTVEFLNPDDRDEIAAWFCESPMLPPFPAGTLFVYSYHGDALPSEQDKTDTRTKVEVGSKDAIQLAITALHRAADAEQMFDMLDNLDTAAREIGCAVAVIRTTNCNPEEIERFGLLELLSGL